MPGMTPELIGESQKRRYINLLKGFEKPEQYLSSCAKARSQRWGTCPSTRS